MLRDAALALAGCLLLIGCGPNKPECAQPHADFQVLIKFANRALPPDTVVHVTYGGSGTEDYRLADPGHQEVVFCEPADAEGNELDASSAVEGSAGEGNSAPVLALSCALWTGGYSKVEVSGTGVTTTTRDLSPREHVCTLQDEILLDPPDAG